MTVICVIENGFVRVCIGLHLIAFGRTIEMWFESWGVRSGTDTNLIE